MNFKSLFASAGAAMAVGVLGAGSAGAVTVDFSFVNTIGNVNGVVSGQIDGLVDNATGPATAIYVNSAPAGLGPYPPPFNVLAWSDGFVEENSFTLSGGVVTQALFEIQYANGGSDQLFLNSDCACGDDTGHTNFLDYGTDDSLFVWNEGGLNAPDGLVLTPGGAPEASTWALMLAGFGGVGAAMRMARRRQVEALAER